MKVNWTDRAVERLDLICAHIAHDAPDAAMSLGRRLLLRSRQIATFPSAGRKVPEFDQNDIRELIEGNYRLIYRVRTERVDVLTVMHCAQLLPTDLRKL